tara:strand:- start:438 stop:584 length:147 start_codon:yes stop_codon:yes gene_type:complete
LLTQETIESKNAIREDDLRTPLSEEDEDGYHDDVETDWPVILFWQSLT